MGEEFARWYQELYPRVLTTLVAATREPSISEEATQEAFAAAFERWPKLQLMRRPDGWVYTVALNRARRALRNRRREHAGIDLHAQRVLHELPIEHDPDLWKALGQLPERARLAMSLRYLADLKERDVARIMGLRPGTVARTLHDARLKLAEALAEHPPRPSETETDEEEEGHAC